jgi:hypothetical protein
MFAHLAAVQVDRVMDREDNHEDHKKYFLRGLRGLRGSIFNVVTNSVKSGTTLLLMSPFRL